MTVFAIPFLLERGHSRRVRRVRRRAHRRLADPRPAAVRAARRAAAARRWRPRACSLLIAAGIAIVVSVHATAAVVAGLVLLGMGNGMATLARATAIADLYGSGAYGTIASVAGAMTTAARAAGPFAAALYAAAVGYTALLWTLAALARRRGLARLPRRAPHGRFAVSSATNCFYAARDVLAQHAVPPRPAARTDRAGPNRCSACPESTDRHPRSPS